MRAIFFGILLSLVSYVADADDDFKISGDISMMSIYTQKPSSQKDQSTFKMPESRLGAVYDGFADMQLVGEIIYAKTRNPTGERWSLQVEKAYFDFPKLLSDSHFVQYGLISQPWDVLESRFWPYRTASQVATGFATRYGYLTRSDLGVLTGARLEDFGHWSFSISNGEGTTADESGPRKEFQAYIEALPFANFRGESKITLAFTVIEGAYENIDSAVAQKERVLLLLGFEQPEGLQGSFEWLWGKDPVDAINAKVADQVDLTSEGGRSIKSSGGCLVLRYRKDLKSEIFARYDILDPAVGVNARGLTEAMLGFGFFPRQFLQFSLAWSEVLYDNAHASSVKDSSEAVFTTRLKW